MISNLKSVIAVFSPMILITTLFFCNQMPNLKNNSIVTKEANRSPAVIEMPTKMLIKIASK